jgi:DNA mismatch endonuclease (patch repair protein)
MDVKSVDDRSVNMSRIKAKDTKAEIAVRKLLRTNGYVGYRLHWGKAPGTPDIAFPGRKIAIFVNGCFWHRHEGCRFAYTPKTREEFWRRKFKDNTKRDARNYALLQEEGWKVVIVWECELRGEALKKTEMRICSELG